MTRWKPPAWAAAPHAPRRARESSGARAPRGDSKHSFDPPPTTPDLHQGEAN